jgi:hypothetical protein
MAIPRIPTRMEEIDPPYIPYTRAKHPILATTMPSIIRAVPPRILERLFMTKSSIGMPEDELVCLPFGEALLDRQELTGRLITRQHYDVHGSRGCHRGLLAVCTTVYEDVGSHEKSG